MFCHWSLHSFTVAAFLRWSNRKPLEGSVASRCGTAVPFHTHLSSDLFLGIAKWLNAFYTHTNTCTHTYTPAQCCDLDSFWFLSADDWQVLNESSLERLPSRPVHQLSTYNTRTHARSLPYLYSHTHKHIYSLFLHAFSIPLLSLNQFVRCWRNVWPSPGDMAALFCLYEAALSNTEGMSAAPLFDMVQYKRVTAANNTWWRCRCMNECVGVLRGPRWWDGIAGEVKMETRRSTFSPPPRLHDSSLLSPLLPPFFLRGSENPIKILCGWIRWRKTYLLHDILSTPRAVTDLVHWKGGGKMCRLPPFCCH